MIDTANLPDSYVLAFVAGQLGLALTAFFPIAILHVSSQQRFRPPWYYAVAVWVMSAGAVFAFGDSFDAGFYGNTRTTYWFRLALGLHFVAIFVFYKTRLGRSIDAFWQGRVNLGLLSAFLVVIPAIWGTFVYNNIQSEVADVRKEIIQNRRETNRGANARVAFLTQQNDTLRAQNDALRRQNDTLQREIRGLQKQLATANARIGDLADLLISLKRDVRRVNQNVERTRRSVDVPDLLRPTGPANFLLPDKVRPLPPNRDQPNRKRRFGFSNRAEELDDFAQKPE